jgi:hypothetical protein
MISGTGATTSQFEFREISEIRTATFFRRESWTLVLQRRGLTGREIGHLLSGIGNFPFFFGSRRSVGPDRPRQSPAIQKMTNNHWQITNGKFFLGASPFIEANVAGRSNTTARTRKGYLDFDLNLDPDLRQEIGHLLSVIDEFPLANHK